MYGEEDVRAAHAAIRVASDLISSCCAVSATESRCSLLSKSSTMRLPTSPLHPPKSLPMSCLCRARCPCIRCDCHSRRACFKLRLHSPCEHPHRHIGVRAPTTRSPAQYLRATTRLPNSSNQWCAPRRNLPSKERLVSGTCGCPRTPSGGVPTTQASICTTPACDSRVMPPFLGGMRG